MSTRCRARTRGRARHADWPDVHALKPRDVTLLSTLAKPTLQIELMPEAVGAWCGRDGVARPWRCRIAVDVAEPAARAAALSRGAAGTRDTWQRRLTPLARDA